MQKYQERKPQMAYNADSGEIDTEPTKAEQKGPRYWEVRLNLGVFRKPTIKNGEKAPPSGTLYQRGGLKFTVEQDSFIVDESTYEKLLRFKERKYATDPIEKVLDSNLIAREITPAEYEARLK